MEQAIKALEEILHSEVQRCKDLVFVLEVERKALIDADSGVILETAARKEKVSRCILEKRREMEKKWRQVFPGRGSRMSIAHIDKVVSGGDPGAFRRIRESLVDMQGAQERIKVLAETNRIIAEDALGFLRELFTSITVGDAPPITSYCRNGQLARQAGGNRFMSQEV